MQVTIRHIPQELLVQTVSVTDKKDDPSNVFSFFCPRCAYQLSQIQGAVIRITPGLEPSEEIPVIVMCPRCRDRYVFQTKHFLKEGPTKVTLFHKSENSSVLSTFNCVICRIPEVQYNNEAVVSLASRQRALLPLALNCVNPQCHQRYLFVDVL